MFAHSQEVPFYLCSKFQDTPSTPSVLSEMQVVLRPDGTPVGFCKNLKNKKIMYQNAAQIFKVEKIK